MLPSTKVSHPSKTSQQVHHPGIRGAEWDLLTFDSRAGHPHEGRVVVQGEKVKRESKGFRFSPLAVFQIFGTRRMPTIP